MEDIKKLAIEAGLCQEHIAAWQEKSIKEMVEYYMSNPNWCIERRFPDIGILRKYRNNNMGLYAEQEVDIILESGRYVFNSCRGLIKIGKFDVVRIYTALDSNLNITIDDHAILILDCYDSSVVNIKNNSKKIARIYQYGDSKIEGETSNIIINNKAYETKT